METGTGRWKTNLSGKYKFNGKKLKAEFSSDGSFIKEQDD